MMHDWAFITPNSKKQVVIWRFEFLLVLSFMHNMLYFWKGALSFYTVDRRLGDRSAYASFFVFFWAPLVNLDECLEKHARPCTIKIKILTIPISLSSTSLITILSPLPDFLHLSISSLLYHSHPLILYTLSNILLSNVRCAPRSQTPLPVQCQIVQLPLLWCHNDFKFILIMDPALPEMKYQDDSPQILLYCPLRKKWIFIFVEKLPVLGFEFMTRVTEEICTVKILYTGRCSFDPKETVEGRWNEIYNPKSF